MNISKLSPETACTFRLPPGTNFNRRKEVDKKMQREYPETYIGMQGKTMYFNFPTSQQRDTFLNELEAMLKRRGKESRRV